MRKNKRLTTAVDSYRRRCLSLPIILLLTAASLAQAQTSHLAAEYYNRGNDRYKSGDLVGAIADYDAALIFKPRWALAYKMRGSARYRKGDLDGCITDYTRAIEIDPHLAPAYYNRGKAQRDKGDLEGAIADDSRSIEINPRLTAAYN